MTIKEPEVKAAIIYFINNTDEIDQNGKQVPRSKYPSAHYKATISLRKLLLSSVEIALGEESKAKKTPEGVDYWEDGDFEWVNASKINPDEKRKRIAERFDSSDLDLTKEMKEALKYYVNSFSELPIMKEETYLAIEEIIK
jgi:hypothetical protein